MKLPYVLLLLVIATSVCNGMEAPITPEDQITFRAIPTIMRMCQEIDNIVSDHAYGYGYANTPEINASESTSQGLIIEMGTVPLRLFSPWGTINLPGAVVGNNPKAMLAACAAAQRFLEKIEAEFIGFEQKSLLNKQWLQYSIISGLSVDEVKKVPYSACKEYLERHKQVIAEKSVADFVGKKAYVDSNSHIAFYRVTTVDGKRLPSGHKENLETGFRYSQDEAKKAWKRLLELNKKS